MATATCPLLLVLGLVVQAPPNEAKDEKPNVIPALAIVPKEGQPKTVPAIKLIKSGEEVARTSLEMKPDVLTTEMHRKSFLMSYPQPLKLSAEKPSRITKEPTYTGSARYGALKVGDGPNPIFDIVFDESAADPKIYFDANQNGDLTDEPAIAWDSVKKQKDRTFLEVLLKIPATWSRSASEVSKGLYGVSLRKTQGADVAFLTRAGARVGTIKIGDKTYPIALAENTADAVFDNARAAKSKKLAAWLMVDLNRDKDYHPTPTGREVLDTSGPFSIDGSWYTAEFPRDGSEVILKRSSAPPPVVEKPRNPLLGAGKTFPEFSFAYADGTKAKFSDSHGKIRVFDLWATWCGPCIASMPRVESLYQKVKGQGVEVIGLNVMDEEARFKEWVKEKSGDFHYRFARDYDGKNHKSSGVAEKLGVYAIPTIFLVDKNDKVVLVLQGFGEEGEAKLKKALTELGVTID
jgi:thiol-disulfide isomerase/thioredoxin